MRFKRILCGVVGATVLASSMFVSAANFPDIKGHWAETYVNAMVKKGYIKGYEDGTFKPNNTVSNTESLILLARIAKDSSLTIAARIFDKTPSFTSLCISKRRSDTIISKIASPKNSSLSFELASLCSFEYEL